MTDNIQYVSQEKYDELKKEFEELKYKKIPEIAARIDDARQMGDLSENAEYHDAREQMSWAQSHVQELEAILDQAQILSGERKTSGVVTLGSTVTVEVNGKKKEYVIVGAQEADPFSGKISNESPLGDAFMGRKVGDQVEVEVPAGVQVYKIKDIT